MQRWRELLFSFAVATAAAWATTLLREPIGRFSSEEYFEIAQVLASTGELNSVLRPPGYVGFLALLCCLSPALLSGHYLFAYLVQGIVHGLTTAVIREEMGWNVRGTAPQLVALTFALSPVALIGAGFLHYDTLHVFLLVLLSAACRRALSSGARPRHAVLAGVVAAVLALVRPMTLPWPLMLLGFVFFQRMEYRRSFALKAGLILLGFILTLAPYTVRNFQKTGRFIVVNAQTGAGLWPMTEVDWSPKSAEFAWRHLWDEIGKPLVDEQAPELSSGEDPFITYTLAANDFFLKRSLENLTEAPMRYVRNVCRNAWFFLTGDQRTQVQYFRLSQGGGDLSPHPVRLFCIVAIETLVVISGLVALIACIVRKRSACLAVGSLLVCLWAVHSALYLDFRYLYVRTPLCILITGIALFGTEEPKQTWLRKAMTVIPGVLFTSSLIAFAATFF